MPFDQDPADDYENYQCDVCGGIIRFGTIFKLFRIGKIGENEKQNNFV